MLARASARLIDEEDTLLRRASLYAICAAALCAGGLFSPSVQHSAVAAEASKAADEGPLLTLDVTAAPLKDVLNLLTRESGVSIGFPTNEKMSTPISVTMKDKSLESILDTVVQIAGVKYKKTADGTYIVGEDVVPDSPAAAMTSEPVIQPEPVVVAPEPKRSTRSELIHLQNINPQMAMIVLGAVPADRALNPNARATAWNGGSLDVFRGLWGPKVDILETNSSGVRVLDDKPSYQPIIINPVPTAASTQDTQVANRATEPSLTANQIGGNYQGGNRTARQTNTRTGTAGTAGQAGVGSSGTSDDIRPDGIDSIIALDQENALLVKGEDDAVQELKDLITLVDLPPKQVMIKAEFVEVSTTETQRLGLDWLLTRPNYVLQTDFRPSGNVIAFVKSGNVTANIRAELTKSNGKIVSAPIISTLNNTAATISIGQQIPFYQSVTTVGSTGPPVTSSQVTYINASTELNVLPQINGDNSITLIMQPRISQQNGFVLGPNGEQAPQISDNTLSTARRVGNGETIVVGGFIRKNDSRGGSKVPILGDLPLIGKLFRSDFATRADTETLVFVTPTVIEEVGGSASIGVVSP